MISNEDAKLYAKLREEQPETFKISQTAVNLLGIVIDIEFVQETIEHYLL